MRNSRGSALAYLPLVIALVAIPGCEPDAQVPEAPFDLSVGFVGVNRIDLSWAESSDTWHRFPHPHRHRDRRDTSDESSYRERPKPTLGFKIQRKLGKTSTWDHIDTVSCLVTAWPDGTAIGNAIYYYRVCAFNEDGDSKWSNEASGTALQAAPTDLTAAPSAQTVHLAWVDHAPDETGYKVERRAEGGAYSQVGTTGPNATSYADTGLSPGTYHYRVRAYNAYGDSAYSNEVTAVISGQDEGGG